MQRIFTRYRKYEIEEAVAKAEKQGFEVIIPIQKARKYYEDCQEGKAKRYVPIYGVEDYTGYIAVVEKEDKE